MRIAIVSAPPVAQKNTPDYIAALAKGIESMGHQVNIIDVYTGNGMLLPSFEYIVVATEALSAFTGKISGSIAKMLATGSSVVGKKSAAFVKKRGFSNRALANLMWTMEKEGMVVNWSEILLNPPHAEEMGKRIGA